jgi:hypothetical protein
MEDNQVKDSEYNKQVVSMTEKGIPVKKAVFHQAIANGYMDPETNFSHDDSKVGRRVQMWLTPTLLVCLHNGKYFATPHANLVYIRF